MKKVMCVLGLSVSVFACKKQMEGTTSTAFSDNIRQYLISNLSPADSATVDYSNLYVYKPPPAPRPWMVRLAFKNKAITKDFILIQSDSLGNCSEGRIVHID